MKTVREIENLNEKKVLLRVDFDVPIVSGVIQEDFRIKKQKETLDYLTERGAKVIMVAHIGDGRESFRNILPKLSDLMGYELGLVDSLSGISPYLEKYKFPGLLENIRKFEGEVDNDENFASNLSKNFGLFVNNAFAVLHRNHVSVSAITKYLDSYPGLLVEEETNKLKEIMISPKEGKIIIMGGAKASTKIPVIKNFLDKSEKILIGGVVANDIFKAKGNDVGNAVVDNNLEDLLAGLDLSDSRIITPDDFNMFENRFPDIGPKAIKHFQNIISGARIIIWNGPMGIFEDDRFSVGTNSIAEAIVNAKAFKVIGGGDTISAVNKIGLLDKFDFVSTGGGAMLAFLAGEKLPGLKALNYYKL